MRDRGIQLASIHNISYVMQQLRCDVVIGMCLYCSGTSLIMT